MSEKTRDVLGLGLALCGLDMALYAFWCGFYAFAASFPPSTFADSFTIDLRWHRGWLLFQIGLNLALAGFVILLPPKRWES